MEGAAQAAYPLVTEAGFCGSPAAGPGRAALTRDSPRVSYRIQAFFWNPGGEGTALECGL